MSKKNDEDEIARKIKLALKKASKAKSKKAAEEEAKKEARKKRAEEAGYDTGYCKTPEHTRFKKGQPSANPGGRPKKKKPNKSVTDIIEEEIYRLYSVNGEDLPAIRIMIRKHVIQGLSGDNKPSRFLEAYIKHFMKKSNNTKVTENEISEEEQMIREEAEKNIRNLLVEIRDEKRLRGADENGLLPGCSRKGASRANEPVNHSEWDKTKKDS